MKPACWAYTQGDLLDQLLEQNSNSGIRAQGPAAQKRFQVFRSSDWPTHGRQLGPSKAVVHYVYIDRPPIGIIPAHACIQELSPNRMVSQSSDQAPTLSSSDTTNADSPLDKASEQVPCLAM